MELKITEKKEEPLLNRTRIEGTLTFDKATPSKEELKNQLANNQKSKPELVAIKHIYTGYGKPHAKIIAYIYNSKQDFEKIEPKPKKAAKAGAAKPAEAHKAEEKPAESPKEAPKSAEKQAKE